MPEYIVKIKQEKARRAEQERNRRLMDELVPPGMRLVPEQERQETLKDLFEAREHIMSALERYPIMRSNVHRAGSVGSRKEDLERRLEKINNAID